MAFYSLLFPLFGAFLLFLKDEPKARFSPWLIASCSLAFSVFFSLFYFSEVKEYHLFTLSLGTLKPFTFTIRLGELAHFLLLGISLIAFFIVLFCLPYSRTKDHTDNLLAKMLLLVFALMLLVVSGSPAMLFLSFALISLFSFLALNFYQKRYSSARASLAGFSLNLAADFSLLLFITGLSLGTSPALSSFFLLLALLIKAGQVPFGIWANETMEAPSPVAALIGSLVIPTSALVLYTFFGGYFMPTIVFWLGLGTALVSALSATLQFEIKKILASNTISATGLILALLSTEQTELAAAVLLLHAVGKTLLHLSYATVIQASSGEHDIRTIGGIGVTLKFSCIGSAFGNLALILIPLVSILPTTSSPLYMTLGLGISFFTTIGLLRPFVHLFFGAPYGSDAILARLCKEHTETLLTLAGLHLLTIVVLCGFITIYSQAFSPLFLYGILIGIVYIIASFSRDFTTRDKIEKRFPKSYLFARAGFGSDHFYYTFLPSLARSGSFALAGKPLFAIGKIERIFSTRLALLQNHISNFAAPKPPSLLMLMLIAAALIIILALSLKEYIV